MKRFMLKGGVSLVAAALLVACAEQRFRLGFESDTAPPTIAIVNSAGDTIDIQSTGRVSFTIQASDNLGLRTISISIRGGLILDTAIQFTSANTSVNLVVDLPQGVNSTVGGLLDLTATATDGNNNSASTTGQLYIINLRALTVVLMSPTVGSVTSPDKQIPIRVLAAQQAGIQRVGWQAIGVVNGSDSAFYALPDTVNLYDTLTVPATTPAGTFIVFGFAVDSAGRRVASASVTVTVQLVLNDTIPPIVTFTVPQRAEALDSITVRAKDPSGISLIGWMALDSTGAQLSGQTGTYSGTLTDVSVTNTLGIPSTYIGLVILKAWASDAAVPPNTDSARVDTLRASPVLADSIIVVNGLTRTLPAGGRVADAIYNPNTLGGTAPEGQIYLTNIDLDRLEVFNISDTSFRAAIPVGSRPWGIALWPRDTVTGANADTVIVANSGGTDLSIVDVALGVQRRRHQLPLFRVQTVHSKVDPATGFINQEITEYTVSDRPQYVGAVCRGGATCRPAGGATGDVLAVYSTTPTQGQSNPLPRRATVRWENLTSGAPESHFFWEQAGSSFTSVTDTLQLWVNRGRGVPEELIQGALCGRIIQKQELGFLDTTFVRNSGNFARVIIGEGGSSSTPPLGYARAIAYDASIGVQTNACGTQIEHVDRGIAVALEVRSFIANTAVPVRAVGLNFNGLTNLIRADSVYVLDRNLRLKGLLPVSGTNVGMDLNFIHDYDPNTGTSTGAFGHAPTANADRIAFVATPNAQIDVYDTYYFGKIATISIRDPVIGPLRVARLPSGAQILVGVTARGVVTVRLPTVANTFPSSRWAGQP
jgi:hypothetical protein